MNSYIYLDREKIIKYFLKNKDKIKKDMFCAKYQEIFATTFFIFGLIFLVFILIYSKSIWALAFFPINVVFAVFISVLFGWLGDRAGKLFGKAILFFRPNFKN